LVVTATAWYLLKELAPILRPLLLAIFLAYVILPIRVYVRGQTRGGMGHLALFLGLCLVLAAVGVIAYGDVVGLAHDVPRLHQRVNDLTAEATRYADAHIPALADTIRRTAFAEEQGAARLQDALGSLLNMTAGVAIEAVQVVFFLILILFEAARFPRRMQNAFANEKTDRMFTMVGSINAAIASYLKAKVKVNIVLALPAMLVLWIFGIKYVVLWGALTFFANFVPYLGSVVACALPILFGFVDLDFGWQPVVAAILLIGVHVSSAYVIEPAMTGKAVDLSPLVVLIALSFWGLCWGVVGMVLAVPLTSVLKIILGNTPGTRPIAELMGGE
jgi:AI-2 transport protein TqsA